jgi:hypothetical protein
MQEPKAKEIFCLCLFMRNIHHILFSQKPGKLYMIQNFPHQLFSLKCTLVCEYLYSKSFIWRIFDFTKCFLCREALSYIEYSKVDKKLI